MPSSPMAFAEDWTPSAVYRAHTRPPAPNCFACSDELVELAASEFRGAGDDEPANRPAVRDGFTEDAERRIDEQRTEVLYLEAEP